MSIYEKIGHRIKMLREKTGMSQDMLSQKIGISRPAVSQIESGERKISADELQKLSHIFHVSVDDLLNPVKEPEVHLHKSKQEKTAKPKMRISVPQKNLQKFKKKKKKKKKNDRRYLHQEQIWPHACRVCQNRRENDRRQGDREGQKRIFQFSADQVSTPPET